MAQHFLHSAAARTLSLKAIYKAGEDAAYETFCKLRWPETEGEAVCPDCGCCETYKITVRFSGGSSPLLSIKLDMPIS